MLDSGTREMILEARDAARKRGLRASVMLHREDSHLMRIGNSSVSLNTSEKLTRLDIRVLDGNREGTHTVLGEVRSSAQVLESIELSAKKAAAAVPKDYTPRLAEVEESVDESPQYDPALEELDPAVKAGVYAEVFEGAGKRYNYSGSWSSGSTELYLVSTANDREAYHKGTDQLFSIVLKHPDAKWELQDEQTGWKAGDVAAEATIDRLKRYADLYEKVPGVRIEPGEYTVVFGPSALAELAGMALMTGVSGRLYEEKMSWTAQNALGDAVLGGNVTLVDDPGNPLTFMYGFDAGGIRRRRFPMIENGRLSALIYDMATAAKYGKEPTGHECEPSLSMSCGTGPEDPLEAVKGMGRVLFVPAIHYMNLPNMSKGIFTGSSRFSAVVLEDGRMAAPMFSTRITDSFQNVFGNIAALSSKQVSVNGSNTYGRRSPVAAAVPSYAVVEKVKITDCAESF